MNKLILTGLFIVGFCLPALHAQIPQGSKSQDSYPVTWITDGLVASDGPVWIVGERSGVFRGWVENDGKQNWLKADYLLDSPRVLPLKANDIELMKWMGLDWHKYFDGITPIEEEIQKLQERLEEVSPADRTCLQAEYGKK